MRGILRYSDGQVYRENIISIFFLIWGPIRHQPIVNSYSNFTTMFHTLVIIGTSTNEREWTMEAQSNAEA